MRFAHQGLWAMGYHRLMGYGVQIPTHQLGGPKMAWDLRGYGLSEAWVKRVSTVISWYHWIWSNLKNQLQEVHTVAQKQKEYNSADMQWGMRALFCRALQFSPLQLAAWSFGNIGHRWEEQLGAWKFGKMKGKVTRNSTFVRRETITDDAWIGKELDAVTYA